MPIRFLPNGVFEFDTIEEVRQFQALLGKNGSAKSIPSASPKSPAGADFEGFFNALEPHQKNLMRGIANANEMLTTNALAQQLKLAPGQVGPMLRHIRTKAQKFHIDPSKLIQTKKERTAPGERASKTYTTRYREQLKDYLSK